MTGRPLWTALLLLGSAAFPAAAQIIGMPSGARQWIQLSCNTVQAGTCCDEAVGGVGSIPYPSPNYILDPSALSVGSTLRGNADSTANRMRSSYFLRRADTAFLYNSMVDQYTVTGPPGSDGQAVTARVRFRCVGMLFVGITNPLSGGLAVGSSNVILEVGTWNPSTDPALNEQFRVSVFDPSFSATAQLPFANYGNTIPTQNFDLVVDRPLNVTVGAAFEVAFGITAGGMGLSNLSGTGSPSDAEYATATIEWILPAGYQITSERGWSDPFAPTCGTADFNCDGDIGTDSDIEAFFACLGGTCPPAPCSNSADFNADGDTGTDADIEAFFRVLGGGSC